MVEHYKYLKRNWNSTLASSAFTVEFIFTVFFLVFTLLTFAKFTQYVEMRKGFQFTDPILQHFPTIDFTRSLFFAIYSSLIIAICSWLHTPYKLMIMFQAYALMVLVRMVTLYVLPLNPPAGMILLQDPFTQYFGTSSKIDNNLFFSGHTATIFLLFLGVSKKLKILFFFATIFIASGVLLQKTHYTVDVLIAPCISFICYYIAHELFRARYGQLPL
ncbi:MAG: phosphatase PAP2-related protein [Bacteriovorax sp.]